METGSKKLQGRRRSKVSGLDHKNKVGEGCFGAKMMSSFTEPVEMRSLGNMYINLPSGNLKTVFLVSRNWDRCVETKGGWESERTGKFTVIAPYLSKRATGVIKLKEWLCVYRVNWEELHTPENTKPTKTGAERVKISSG